MYYQQRNILKLLGVQLMKDIEANFIQQLGTNIQVGVSLRL